MRTAPRRASVAVTTFVDSLRAEATRRQRRAFLDEYLAWIAHQGDGAVSAVATDDLLDEENALAWLADAQRGLTRRRPGLEGPTARAAVNSMAARTSSVNTFSRYWGHPLELQPPAPEFAARLTPTEAHRTLRLLSGHHPAGMLEATWERSVALIALAVCTGQGISALHPMRLADLELDRSLPRARVGEEWYPLDAVSRGAIARWKTTHKALTAGHLKVLKGGNVEELWVTTAPGRPRGGQPAPPAGLPAGIRTLEAAHRKLTATALGSPLLFEQFCGVADEQEKPHGSTPHAHRLTAMDTRVVSTTVSDDVDFLGGPYGGTTQTLAARPGAPDELPAFLFWWKSDEIPEREAAGRTAEEVAETRSHYQLSGTSPETGRPRYVWCAPLTPASHD